MMDVFYKDMEANEFREILMPLNTFSQKIVEDFKKNKKMQERLNPTLKEELEHL